MSESSVVRHGWRIPGSSSDWREMEARDKNIPRGRIARDETLADIAGHPPKTQADLAKVRGLSAGWKDNEIGRRLMQVHAPVRRTAQQVEQTRLVGGEGQRDIELRPAAG